MAVTDTQGESERESERESKREREAHTQISTHKKKTYSNPSIHVNDGVWTSSDVLLEQ